MSHLLSLIQPSSFLVYHSESLASRFKCNISLRRQSEEASSTTYNTRQGSFLNKDLKITSNLNVVAIVYLSSPLLYTRQDSSFIHQVLYSLTQVQVESKSFQRFGSQSQDSVKMVSNLKGSVSQSSASTFSRSPIDIEIEENEIKMQMEDPKMNSLASQRAASKKSRSSSSKVGVTNHWVSISTSLVFSFSAWPVSIGYIFCRISDSIGLSLIHASCSEVQMRCGSSCWSY